MNDTKGVQVIEPKNAADAAQILVTGVISQESNNSTEFIALFNQLEAKYDDIEVHVVNCYGGSTYQGVVIHDTIKNSKARTTTITKGLSASMGAPISLAGNHKVVMHKHSRLMFHKVSFAIQGNAEDLKAAAENMENVEQDLVNIVAAKIGKDEKWVRDTFFKSSDTYVPADVAKNKYKLIDDVVDGNLKMDVPTNTLKTGDVQAVANFYETQLNTDNNTNNTSMKNIEVLASALAIANKGFTATTEAEIAAEITAQANTNVKLVAENTQLKADVQKANDDKAEALVAAAVEADKIDKGQSEKFVDLAKTNYDSVKAIFEGMASQESAADRVRREGLDTQNVYKGWSFDKLHKDAPQELARIKAEEPANYKKLYTEEFGE